MGLEAQKSSIDIGIIVKDIDAMMKFYGEILGLDLEATIPMPGGGTMNRFKVGDSIIKLIALDPAPSAEAQFPQTADPDDAEVAAASQARRLQHQGIRARFLFPSCALGRCGDPAEPEDQACP